MKGVAMYYQFLIEDKSGSLLIHQIMEKIKTNYPQIEYDCKAFHGIGHLPKGNDANEIKTGQILNDLKIYLRGFDKSLKLFPAVIVIVLDNDDRNTEDFLKRLNQVAKENFITVNHVFCIAIEELEAWLLGDEKALLVAYPLAKIQFLHSYKQDSICGTWEVLADIVYKGGYQKLKKYSTSYEEIGKLKCEWACKIGEHLDIRNNKSPSFQYFIREIEKRAQTG